MDKGDGKKTEEYQKSNTVNVSFPREIVEREFMCDLMALRDERVLARLPREVRERLGDDPLAGVAVLDLTTEAIAGIGSVSQGTFCHGIKSFSGGVTCKILKIPKPS